MDSALFLDALANLFTVEVLLAITAGVVGGIVIGALPGLSGTMGIALLVPITFGMDPVAGISMLAAIYTSATYGGSISAILINTPGTPAGAATALDGYQLTRQGKGAKALAVSAIASMVGGVVSAFALLLLAPPLAQVSLAFSAPEYFLLAVFGLLIIGSLSAGSLLKGFAAGVLGLLLATVGIDILTGYPRFTFGTTALQSGIELVPALIGLFSLSQVLILAEGREGATEAMTKGLRGRALPTLAELKRMAGTVVRSSGIGVFVGILPGAGGDIGSWVGYNEAKRFSKGAEKEEFGRGSIKGVAAAESANNAVTGGAMIPLLTLGIPGSSATAVILGGLLIHGMQPGGALFTEQADTTYAIMLGFLLANILMGIIAIVGARYFVIATRVPMSVLVPIIVALCVVGTYAVNNSVADVWVMLVAGLVGYLMRKVGVPPAPIVLGLILGAIAEKGVRQSLVMAQGDVLGYYLSRPLSLVLLGLILMSLLAPVLAKRMRRSVPRNAEVEA
ncbi:tripartite tricarboxylate transporter permease [Streptomonospora nanhaiensis]|uniref:Putative tricarboxylic transport membrane protein n=1 Tax=Streptomonospora nanhaiensis TaxID=1323731 RepID=A0A853BW54_9ACTN|nr:tripartite tricarboxylate transporter permease [Streptomonospora nanhaiensis]MBX9391851.1 tripartite tricarboxylate transporter permease [Streptomonospora nanhaiensis]NYI98975.1 putative tricarboxylic transport membrane protein [Streptomonospora nanhaiensis]